MEKAPSANRQVMSIDLKFFIQAVVCKIAFLNSSGLVKKVDLALFRAFQKDVVLKKSDVAKSKFEVKGYWQTEKPRSGCLPNTPCTFRTQ